MEDKTKVISLIIILIFLILSLLVLENKSSGRVIFDFNSEDNINNKDLNQDNEEANLEQNNQNNIGANNNNNNNNNNLIGNVIKDVKEALGLCSIKQIGYSMIDFSKESICNKNEGGICINKTISCSIEVKNRDLETEGFFEVELIFIEEGKSKENLFDLSI